MGIILAGRMNLSPSRASRVIENMVKKKVLIRDIDCTDRRKCTIELTRSGVEIKERINSIKDGFYQKVMQNIDPDIAISINQSFRILSDSIEKV